MASCKTAQWTTTSPYVRLTVTQTSSTALDATLTWKLEYYASSAANASNKKNWTVTIAGNVADSGSYSIDGKTGWNTISTGTKTITKSTSAQTIKFSVSFDFNLTWSGTYCGTKSASGSISVAAKTSYTIKYNANGGTGAPSNQTKWHGTTLTLSSTKPKRTGYTFQGWALTAEDAENSLWYYQPGGTCGKNENLTLYAVWKAITYTIKYNANGGSGAPGNQTKTHGVNLSLSNTKPTRAKYTFLGWSTSSSATSAMYAAGANYSANANATLYAVWKLAYVEPNIYSLSAIRCDSNGVESANGTYALVKFNWNTFLDVTDIYITIDADTVRPTIPSNATSGTVSQLIGGTLDGDATYRVRVFVSDADGDSIATTTVRGLTLPFDVLSGGRGIAFGKTAELLDHAEFGMITKFNEPVYGTALGLDKLPSIEDWSDFNDYRKTGSWAVYLNATAETISNIPIPKAGRLIVAAASGAGLNTTGYKYLRQTYIPYQISYPTFERDVYQGYDNAWQYGDWVTTSLVPQKVLWSGAYFMLGAHTIELSEAISKQSLGIVLAWGYYDDSGTAQSQYWHYQFIPKSHVVNSNGKGVNFPLGTAGFKYLANKYIYVYDTYITGHDVNNDTGTISGITFDNTKWVLRYVIGV